MPKDKKTSPRVASIAGEQLQNPKTPKRTRVVDGSALGQTEGAKGKAKPPKKRGK